MSGGQTVQVVAITGAGSGIGRATALLLAHRGAHVACGDIDEGAVGATVANITDGGGKAVGVIVDVRSGSSCKALVDEALKLGQGRLDGVVNVAGVGAFGMTVETTSEQDWERVLRTNLTSVFLMGKHAVPALRASGGGAIVNVASVHAVATMEGCAAYAASKGGVVALTKAMALDHARDRIRVVALAPGSVDTPMSAAALQGETDRPFPREPDVIGRMASPEEVAACAAWLLSPESSFVNGSTLYADGGLLARLL